MSDSKTEVKGGCGCLSIIVGIIVIWAVGCGVTWKGVHYELKCGCDRGVEIEESARPR
jgi:hypothetical protein